MSFDTTIKALTLSSNFFVPISALILLFLPSKVNGFVTIPTVKIFISFASSAITGIAPVPVPPPIPAVKNSISVFSNIFLICSLLSRAAFSPIISFAPAPKPFVVCFPICNTFLVFALLSVPVSVFNKYVSIF